MIQRDLASIVNFVNDDSDFLQFKKTVIYDYWLSLVSRECSVVGRKEVLTGKAKFGIVGDGKEVAQIAMAKSFKLGDWRSGYYRDQSLAMALGICSVEEFFAQLYADTINDSFSAGRQMNCHFATPMLDKNGDWLNLMEQINSSSDISCTAGQMGRALGIAQASTLYKKIDFDKKHLFSNNGNEVSFCTIGDASTSEGAFWETMNSAAVMHVPLVVAVWDDGYGISVPIELQTVKASISKALEGFLIDDDNEGIYIFTAKAWDYQELCSVFEAATNLSRKNHRPALVHVQEVTQPQGHSTSGSHERYKSKERLDWEKDFDCIKKMAEWMVINAFATNEEIEKLNQDAKDYVKEHKKIAWENYTNPIKIKAAELMSIIQQLKSKSTSERFDQIEEELKTIINPFYSELYQLARKLKFESNYLKITSEKLDFFIAEAKEIGQERYDTNLYSETKHSALNVPEIKPLFSTYSEELNGYQIINKYFDVILDKYPEVIAFGEDVGQIGDVNQGFAGLQDKYGKHRVFDAGIREWTIVGQAIGAAMRGLRPIAEIQYLDYINYAMSPLSDDLATIRYRSNGIQKSPAIIRTRGHRLEGIWHAGSPMGMIINSMKGIYLCVPRNMVQAAGMYNTILKSDDPAIVVECLNGYRLKEKLPDNLGEYTVPLGRPEIMKSGSDVTIVTYGSTLREVLKALPTLDKFGISAEIIDVQTIVPFDLDGIIIQSLKKTNTIIFVDEDVPGGATSYMMSQVLDIQNGYRYLDKKPLCITSKDHRTPFGSDGDYFTKPFAEDIIEQVIALLQE
jgi:2-oxoisovalerate dehydrogenase E1 component